MWTAGVRALWPVKFHVIQRKGPRCLRQSSVRKLAASKARKARNTPPLLRNPFPGKNETVPRIPALKPMSGIVKRWMHDEPGFMIGSNFTLNSCILRMKLPQTDWWMDGLIVATTQWLIGSLIDWLIHWLVHTWNDWLSGWLVDWWIDWLIDWLTDGLIDGLVGCLSDWLAEIGWSVIGGLND